MTEFTHTTCKHLQVKEIKHVIHITTAVWQTNTHNV